MGIEPDDPQAQAGRLRFQRIQQALGRAPPANFMRLISPKRRAWP